MKRMLILGPLLLMLVAAAPVQADGWKVLGERTVSFSSDRDVISVRAEKGLYSKIKLQVRRRGVRLEDVTITYGDGSSHTLKVRSFIKAGGETRVFDLPGDARVIKKVSFLYRGRGCGRGKALVRLLGKQAGADEPAPTQPVAGWQLLGAQKVNFAVDRDVIRVSSSEGTFTKIKLKVLHNRIELLDLKVYFGNGGSQDIKLRRLIKAGGETRTIDLDGGARVIKKVKLLYRSGLAKDTKAEIHLWGKSQSKKL